MPTLIWNSPAYDQTVHQTVVDLITDFNTKLLEVGLIDITSLNSTNISTIPNTAGGYTINNANRYASQILATNSIIPPTRFV